MPELPEAHPVAAQSSRTNHIFVDYENVRDLDLAFIHGKSVIVHLILGGQQKNVPVSLFKEALHAQGQIRVIETEKSGKNALDFVLAYHVGVTSAADPKAYYHIVSRDTGFDALISHLKTQQILARRDESFALAFDWKSLPLATATPISTSTASTNTADRVQEVTARLTKNGKNRPKRKKTLLSQINAYYQKQLTETELEDILQKLIKNRVITIGPTNEVIYKV